MTGVVFLKGKLFQAEHSPSAWSFGDKQNLSAHECIRQLEELVRAHAGEPHKLTFQPTTGYIFSNRIGSDPCGVLFKEGYRQPTSK